MGLFSGPKKRVTGAVFTLQAVGPGFYQPTGKPLLPIGITDATCPHCHAELKKKPASKTKCRSCGNSIYVRTRPLDNQRISVTEEQIELVVEQWAIRNGTHAEFLSAQQSRDEEKERLFQELGREPSRDEVNLGLLNGDAAEFAAKKDWPAYRCARREIGEILKGLDWKAALVTYLEVCYVDLNGPTGCCDPKLSPPFSPINAGDSWVNAADEISIIAESGEFNLQQMESSFFPMAEQLHKKLGLPISPPTAWTRIKAKLSLPDDVPVPPKPTQVRKKPAKSRNLARRPLLPI